MGAGNHHTQQKKKKLSNINVHPNDFIDSFTFIPNHSYQPTKNLELVERNKQLTETFISDQISIALDSRNRSFSFVATHEDQETKLTVNQVKEQNT